MEMMLQTQNLCKYFRKQKAVNNVSLNIEKEQIYGLLGPNGAGKSTTLKMLTGLSRLKAIDDLNTFIEKGILRKRGAGRTVFYVWQQEE